MENTNEEKKEQPAVNAGERIQPEAASIIERASSERQKLEETIAKTEELLRRNEEILAKQILGGRAEAGIQPVPVKEESAVEYSKRLINGKYNL